MQSKTCGSRVRAR